MARIAGINIQTNKRVVVSLTYVYGIGDTIAEKICTSAGVDINKKVKDLTEGEVVSLRSAVEAYQVEGDLRREISLNIKHKKDIRCYQGLRHIKKLPVHGQNTHSNARTRKGKAVAIAGKKKPTK